jgi:hypothetical protein
MDNRHNAAIDALNSEQNLATFIQNKKRLLKNPWVKVGVAATFFCVGSLLVKNCATQPRAGFATTQTAPNP